MDARDDEPSRFCSWLRRGTAYRQQHTYPTSWGYSFDHGQSMGIDEEKAEEEEEEKKKEKKTKKFPCSYTLQYPHTAAHMHAGAKWKDFDPPLAWQRQRGRPRNQETDKGRRYSLFWLTPSQWLHSQLEDTKTTVDQHDIILRHQKDNKLLFNKDKLFLTKTTSSF